MRKIVALITVILFASCVGKVNNEKPIVAVSIAPLGYIVEQIADSTVHILVTVPETTSPETYEMTAKQMAQISDAQLYFAIGLIDFEQQLGAKIQSIAPKTQYVNLSQNMTLLEGSCGHDHGDGHNHDHLVDPHVWLSPRLMRQIAGDIVKLLCEKNPNLAELYGENYDKLVMKIDSLDSVLVNKFDSCKSKSFAIVHPSLTYFAKDYGLNQISIEQDGKEPSVLKIKQVIDSLTLYNVKQILYSRQNPNATAQQVASQIGADVVEYDPLSGAWYDNIVYLSDVLCN